MRTEAERRGLRLKQILGERRAVLVPGAFNALSARMIADLGFEAIYVTGAGLANAFLGVPDIGLLTLPELVENVAAIRDAVETPLIVDADTAFGNAVNTTRTVRVLERAGADAIQIEDQVFPKRCGHFSGKAVVPIEEILSKIKAAADTRDNLLIVARTDARAVHGLEAAIERSIRFLEAGADAIFVEAPRTEEEMVRITSHVDAPHVANMVIGGVTPQLPQDRLRDHGFAIVLYANAALQGAMLGVESALNRLKRDGVLNEASGVTATFAARQRAVRKPYFDELEKRYAYAGSAVEPER
jgi:2-methylisocitrate lyase-like PEP mutase family enzyme